MLTSSRKGVSDFVILSPAMLNAKFHHTPQEEVVGYKSVLGEKFTLDALTSVVVLALISELGIYLCAKLFVLHTASASGCGVQRQLVIV